VTKPKESKDSKTSSKVAESKPKTKAPTAKTKRNGKITEKAKIQRSGSSSCSFRDDFGGSDDSASEEVIVRHRTARGQKQASEAADEADSSARKRQKLSERSESSGHLSSLSSDDEEMEEAPRTVPKKKTASPEKTAKLPEPSFNPPSQNS